MAGDIRVGDTVASLPSGKESKVKSIVTFDGDLEKASAGMAITLTLEDEIDVSRGDMLVRPHQKPQFKRRGRTENPTPAPVVTPGYPQLLVLDSTVPS